jgi:ABC-2 type transport system ATP-binding protein
MNRSGSSPAVELKGAAKSFGSVQALKGIDLTVQQGETVALLGPNGAGKTTAISLMLGLRRPTAGRALLLGRDPRELASRRRIGVMLQESGVPHTLKVREVAEMIRRLYDRPMDTLVALERAQLHDKANALVATLSGGQRQRLYFALAIIGNPDVLFLDEPSVGLDVESRRSFWEQIDALVGAGKTVILTTHYLEEADALADRIVVINQGLIVAEGTPSQIKATVGGKRVRFRAPGLSDNRLHALPGIQRITRTADRIEFYAIEPEPALARLFGDGVALSELEVVGAGLEEAFMNITNTTARGA